MIFWYLLLLLLGRVVGVSALPIIYASVAVYMSDEEKLFQVLFGLGLITDIMVGSLFGMSSLLLMLLYLEIKIYKNKVTSASVLSVLMLSLLAMAQADLLWGVRFELYEYLVGAILSFVLWTIKLSIEKRGFGGGVYLRRGN